MGERYTEGGAWDPKAAPASPPKPEGQEWPFTDPKAMESIERGIADAKAGRIYGTGEGMREAGGARELVDKLLSAFERMYRAWRDSTEQGIAMAEMQALREQVVARMVEAAPAPQGLREAADWLEQAAAIRDRANMSHPAAIAWARAGYPHTFTEWLCLEVAKRLRALSGGEASEPLRAKPEASNHLVPPHEKPSSSEIPNNSHKGEG